MATTLTQRDWIRTPGNWRDSFSLNRLDDGWELRGKIRNGRPNDLVDSRFEGFYQVLLDEQWQTRQATLQIVRGDRSAEIQIRIDEQGRWLDLDDEHLADLDGIPDVDLFLTPATNMIPIRRLDLGIGAARDARAVLIRLDDDDRLVATWLDQRYERVDARTYRYVSFDEYGQEAFSATLIVDAEGVIESYGNFWTTAVTF